MMNAPRFAAALLAASLVAAPATFADDAVWQGANVSGGDGAGVDVSDPNLWDTNAVPGQDDVAYFQFNQGSTHLFIDDTHVDFDPGAIVFNANHNTHSGTAQIHFDKSLTMSGLELTIYNGVSGGRDNNRVRIGTQTTDAIVWTLTGDRPLDISGNPAAAWGAFDLGTGNVTIDMTGENIVFAEGQQSYKGGTRVNGGTHLENAALDANSTFTFSNPASSIHLEGQGILGPTIGFGFHNVVVDSSQTWTADDTAFLSFNMRHQNDAGGDRQAIIQSADGGRLDNLGAVNLALSRGGTSSANTQHAAMDLLGGTYGSVSGRGGSSSHRSANIFLAGDVDLVGNTVAGGNGTDEAEATEYTIELDGGSGTNISHWRFNTAGHDLTLAGGLLLREGRDGGTQSYHMINTRLQAEGSAIGIGGNVRIESDNMGPQAPVDGFIVNRNIGITGNASTVINLAGNWDHRTGYINGVGLSQSTLNLVGGGGEQTFEVGDAAATPGVQNNSHAFASFNVGDDETAALVKLVNDHLNNNDVTVDGELATDREGEKLIAGELVIHADSTLDANLGSASVLVGGLSIDPATGLLDLNTGRSLGLNEIVANFVGLGDQTAAWTALADRVIDSSNAGVWFEATLDDDLNTVWMAVPEPATLGLLGAGLLLALGRRRRVA